jgi:glyoxylase-like metal-dependent hydrolase (beta-lactamase superfamily II)
MSALAKEYGIPVYAHEGEMFTLEKTNPEVCRCYGLPLPELHPFTYVSEGDDIAVGSLRFRVIETPGHSKGGLCFFAPAERVLFSGDSLFAGAIGRTDHPGGDYDTLMRSIFEKLLMLDGDTRVLPGHGPSSDISTERMTNPFLMPFNEPNED